MQYKYLCITRATINLPLQYRFQGFTLIEVRCNLIRKCAGSDR